MLGRLGLHSETLYQNLEPLVCLVPLYSELELLVDDHHAVLRADQD